MDNNRDADNFYEFIETRSGDSEDAAREIMTIPEASSYWQNK